MRAGIALFGSGQGGEGLLLRLREPSRVNDQYDAVAHSDAYDPSFVPFHTNSSLRATIMKCEHLFGKAKLAKGGLSLLYAGAEFLSKHVE